MLEHAPRFDAGYAATLARSLFGIDAAAVELTSERDQNFLLSHAGEAGVVLKVANALEDERIIRAQQRAMDHLAAGSVPVPRVVPMLDGTRLRKVAGPHGEPGHFVWAITGLPGVPLGSSQHRSGQLLEHFGRMVGTLTRSLQSFDDPALHREFHWDLARGRHVIDQYRALVSNAAMSGTLETLVGRFDRITAPLLPSLRRSVIHADLNDFNVLVGGGGDAWTRNQRVTGIVDFGDMVHSFTVGDLAIAAAYVMLGADDPLAAAAALVRGCHAEFPLRDDELSALFGLVALRLCTSVCVAAHQRRLQPGNAYLDVSQAPIRRLLPLLARIPFGLAEAVFRGACGLEPVAVSARVRRWLEDGQANFAPVVGGDLRTEPSLVLDLSVASPLISGSEAQNAEPLLTARIFDRMREAGVRVSVGRYDEPRLLYATPAFASAYSFTDERRTIHLGLDLFADAGTPVHAPLEGTVHAFHDNATLLDYGPVIILRHRTGDGTEFFTLYGHLSRESLEGLVAGQAVARGAQIATLGAPAVNGGWTPHLHLQIITDLLELGTDFPGVGVASQRAAWRSLAPDANLLVGVPAERFPPAQPTTAGALALRARHIGGNLSIAYRNPVRVVRGWRQYLFDDCGRRYVDAYNNVPHVGHAHPRVVRAIAAQASVLNTNTRYVNDLLATYAERLAATLPAPLDVCYFLNSASEANELALRLTRAHTKSQHMIVLQAAYHGNTTSLIDISPYKHAGRGGLGAPNWVHVAPIADDYRGPWKRSDPDAGANYAGQVQAIIDEIGANGDQLGGFIAETCPSVGGQIIFPAGYLAHVYGAVRKAGGLCIADEVQTGLGRMGTHFWAFEAQGVVPDIVVMGKPLGNGHPMAAVVTTRAVADAFDNGMEFFSTFGGNTVSCAVGIEVLEVLRDEQLQAHALRTGAHMLQRLRSLAERHEIVGDVRGSGLFLGVELVRDRITLEPAGAEASFVADRMRESGILLGTDGPHHNVVKIRPPMPFSAEDADRLVAALDTILTHELPS